ncbi:MAG: Flp family type IVb pilin [Sphingomonas adhaesiva]|uniref:Flp family type IVb pilin n=1 Tax=Sphingomonas adhaesiva TaxID=28212 RepID=UPI002FFC13DD
MLRPIRPVRYLIRVARLIRLVADSRGATAIEYGLILAILSLGLVGAMNNWSAANNGLWEFVRRNLVIAS